MRTSFRTSKVTLSLGMALLCLSACDWVDSTGVQGEPLSPMSAGALTLRNAQPLTLQEELPATVTIMGQGSDQQNWTWTPEQGDVRASCEAIEGFNSQLAVTRIEEACTNSQECTIAFVEDFNGDTAQFNVRLPQLRGPVALAYTLSTITEEGTLLTREQPLCGISLNEAPLAVDDNYIVLKNQRRIVSAEDPDSLSANDKDDEDIRNQSLRINPVAVQMPSHAAEFSLGEDGSFIYRASADAPINSQGFITDSFVYSTSDGIHDVEATAFITIVDSNRSPVRAQRIPDLEVSVVLDDNEPPTEFDLSSYFYDPDGDSLHFSIRQDLLPQSGNIAISSAGVLTARPTFEDLGDWRLIVDVTDGLASSSDIFDLEILEPEQDNLPPIAEDIHNRIVQNSFSYDVSVFFSDPDGDQLSFSATGLPVGVKISKAGLITGEANNANAGISLIWVTANDDRGGSVTDRFALVIN
ncbi:MAG: putative Ig domain-containing protein [Granulosicoccus sp.]